MEVDDDTSGLISIAMIPISIIGSFAFSLIFVSAPLGIVSGIGAIRRGNRQLGIVGLLANSMLLAGLLALWIMAAAQKGD